MSNGPDISTNIQQTFVGTNFGQLCVMLDEYVKKGPDILLTFKPHEVWKTKQPRFEDFQGISPS